MQLPAILVCTWLPIIAVTQTLNISVKLARTRRQREKKWHEILFIFTQYVVAWIPVIGTIWLIIHPMDINAAGPVVMCILSMVTVNFELTIGYWSIVKGLAHSKFYHLAASIDFLLVLVLNAIGSYYTLNLNHFRANICYSIGNSLCFSYLSIVYRFMSGWNFFSRPNSNHGGLPWAWYFSLPSVLILTIVPIYLHNEWVLPGTLIINWWLLVPWAIITPFYPSFFKTAAQNSIADLDSTTTQNKNHSSESIRQLVGIENTAQHTALEAQSRATHDERREVLVACRELPSQLQVGFPHQVGIAL